MKKQGNNYAFIDFHNLFISSIRLGWYIDYSKLRIYLEEKYAIKKAFVFVWYVPKNQKLYLELQQKWYILVFKPTLETKDGGVKGNCDADLVLRTMIELNNFDRALIVSGDGDFYCLVDYLLEIDKLERVISPSIQNTSKLMKKSAGKHIDFMDNLRNKLEYKKRTP